MSSKLVVSPVDLVAGWWLQTLSTCTRPAPLASFLSCKAWKRSEAFWCESHSFCLWKVRLISEIRAEKVKILKNSLCLDSFLDPTLRIPVPAGETEEATQAEVSKSPGLIWGRCPVWCWLLFEPKSDEGENMELKADVKYILVDNWHAIMSNLTLKRWPT